MDTLERIGELDHTLIFVTSDNGTSGEGSPFPFAGDLDRVIITLTD